MAICKSENTKVTVEYPDGTKEIKEIPPGDWAIICGTRMYLAYQQWYPTTGSFQLTIKRVPEGE